VEEERGERNGKRKKEKEEQRKKEKGKAKSKFQDAVSFFHEITCHD
jgi:hypothetical protein